MIFQGDAITASHLTKKPFRLRLVSPPLFTQRPRALTIALISVCLEPHQENERDFREEKNCLKIKFCFKPPMQVQLATC